MGLYQDWFKSAAAQKPACTEAEPCCCIFPMQNKLMSYGYRRV